MEEPERICLDQSFDDSSLKSKYSLAGKILTYKTLNKVGVQNVMNKAWRTEDSFTISALGNNTYAFHFQSEDDLCRVISQEISPINVINYGVRPPEIVAYPKPGDKEDARQKGQVSTVENNSCPEENIRDPAEVISQTIPHGINVGPSTLVGAGLSTWKSGPIPSPVISPYFVEEPDSPQAFHRNPTPETQKSLTLEVAREGEIIKTPFSPRAPMEVALSSVFDRFLSLKRKEREDDEAPQNTKKSGHLIQWKEDAPIRSDSLSISPAIPVSYPLPLPPC
ncbi:hypothetical protein RHMOL_Rhmol02G0136700 [Rhododendron molle]|uniref:Uncharacterized protein n=1 Tax=Rhododendron molle TaxID=49168 RepID=A0ACC0PR68_RHOML|nr:hypothetical protein RHMOL_Rhmol02G0136700 [Rhododendron molle]